MNKELLGGLSSEELQYVLNEALTDVLNNIPVWPSEKMAQQMSITDQSFGMCEINDVLDLFYKGKHTFTFYQAPKKKETPTMKIYYNKTTHQFIAIEGDVAIQSYVANQDELPEAAQAAMAKELALGNNGSTCYLLEPDPEIPAKETEKDPVPPQAPNYEKGEKVEGQQS